MGNLILSSLEIRKFRGFQSSRKIRKFRGFQHLQIERPGRVNLIPLPFHSQRNSK
jgi:hypothetical protein